MLSISPVFPQKCQFLELNLVILQGKKVSKSNLDSQSLIKQINVEITAASTSSCNKHHVTMALQSMPTLSNKAALCKTIMHGINVQFRNLISRKSLQFWASFRWIFLSFSYKNVWKCVEKCKLLTQILTIFQGNLHFAQRYAQKI